MIGCSTYDKKGSVEVLVPTIDAQIDSFIASAKFRTNSKAEYVSVSFRKGTPGLYEVHFHDITPSYLDDFLGFKMYGNSVVYFFCDNSSKQFFKVLYKLPPSEIVMRSVETKGIIIDWYSDGMYFDGREFFRTPVDIPVIEADTTNSSSIPNQNP